MVHKKNDVFCYLIQWSSTWKVWKCLQFISLQSWMQMTENTRHCLDFQVIQVPENFVVVLAGNYAEITKVFSQAFWDTKWNKSRNQFSGLSRNEEFESVRSNFENSLESVWNCFLSSSGGSASCNFLDKGFFFELNFRSYHCEIWWSFRPKL